MREGRDRNHDDQVRDSHRRDVEGSKHNPGKKEKKKESPGKGEMREGRDRNHDDQVRDSHRRDVEGNQAQPREEGEEGEHREGRE